MLVNFLEANEWGIKAAKKRDVHGARDGGLHTAPALIPLREIMLWGLRNPHPSASHFLSTLKAGGLRQERFSDRAVIIMQGIYNVVCSCTKWRQSMHKC